MSKIKNPEATARIVTARNQVHVILHSSDVSMPYYRFQLLEEAIVNLTAALDALERA